MVCVVFDTSFLLNCLEAHIHPFEEVKKFVGNYTILIPSPVIKELKGLSRSDRNASIALKLIENVGFVEVWGERTADIEVVRVAFEKQCYLASTDKEVRRNARSLGVKLVTLRKSKYIEVE